jgi:hypothetical protein
MSKITASGERQTTSPTPIAAHGWAQRVVHFSIPDTLCRPGLERIPRTNWGHFEAFIYLCSSSPRIRAWFHSNHCIGPGRYSKSRLETSAWTSPRKSRRDALAWRHRRRLLARRPCGRLWGRNILAQLSRRLRALAHQGWNHKYEPVYANQFAMFQQSEGDAGGTAQVLMNGHPKGGELSAWQWDYPVGAGDYYALFPKAWFDYKWDQVSRPHVCWSSFRQLFPTTTANPATPWPFIAFTRRIRPTRR